MMRPVRGLFSSTSYWVARPLSLRCSCTAAGTSIPLYDIVRSGLIRPAGAADPLVLAAHGAGIDLPEPTFGCASEQSCGGAGDRALDSSSEDSGQTPATFPLLLQAQHPATGAVVWAVHPCETLGMVDEIMRAERQQDRGNESADNRAPGGDDVALAWLKCWLTVCSSILDFRLQLIYSPS